MSILGQRPPRIESPLPPLPLGAPPRSLSVIRELRAGDRAVGMRVPEAQHRVRLTVPGFEPPRIDPEPGAWRALAALYATVAVYDHVADEIDALLAALVELAPYTAKAVAL